MRIFAYYKIPEKKFYRRFFPLFLLGSLYATYQVSISVIELETTTANYLHIENKQYLPLYKKILLVIAKIPKICIESDIISRFESQRCDQIWFFLIQSVIFLCLPFLLAGFGFEFLSFLQKKIYLALHHRLQYTTPNTHAKYIKKKFFTTPFCFLFHFKRIVVKTDAKKTQICLVSHDFPRLESGDKILIFWFLMFPFGLLDAPNIAVLSANSEESD